MSIWVFVLAVVEHAIVDAEWLTQPVFEFNGHWNVWSSLVEQVKACISVDLALKYNEAWVDRLVVIWLLAVSFKHMQLLLHILLPDALKTWIFRFKHFDCHVIWKLPFRVLLLLLEGDLVLEVPLFADQLLFKVFSHGAQHVNWVGVHFV